MGAKDQDRHDLSHLYAWLPDGAHLAVTLVVIFFLGYMLFIWLSGVVDPWHESRPGYLVEKKAWHDWEKAGKPGTYTEFLAPRMLQFNKNRIGHKPRQFETLLQVVGFVLGGLAVLGMFHLITDVFPNEDLAGPLIGMIVIGVAWYFVCAEDWLHPHWARQNHHFSPRTYQGR